MSALELCIVSSGDVEMEGRDFLVQNGCFSRHGMVSGGGAPDSMDRMGARKGRNMH